MGINFPFKDSLKSAGLLKEKIHFENLDIDADEDDFGDFTEAVTESFSAPVPPLSTPLTTSFSTVPDPVGSGDIYAALRGLAPDPPDSMSEESPKIESDLFPSDDNVTLNEPTSPTDVPNLMQLSSLDDTTAENISSDKVPSSSMPQLTSLSNLNRLNPQWYWGFLF